MIEIRRATQDDTQVIAEFNIAMAKETEDMQLDPSTVLAGVQALVANPQLGFYLVATNNSDVVGVLMVTNEWSDWRNGVFWWIQSVFVRSDFRRQGIYRSLYEKVQELSSNDNVCGYRLYVEKDNNSAQQTYKKLGMSETHYRMYEQPSKAT